MSQEQLIPLLPRAENGKKGYPESLTTSDFCSVYHLDTVLLIHQQCSGSWRSVGFSFSFFIVLDDVQDQVITGPLQPGPFLSAHR